MNKESLDMTTTATLDDQAVAEHVAHEMELAQEKIVHHKTETVEDRRRRYSVSILLGFFAVLLAVLGAKTTGHAKFALSDLSTPVEERLPTVVLPGQVAVFVTALLCLAAAGCYFFLVRRYAKIVNAFAGVAFVLALIGLLTWAVSRGDSPFIMPRLFTGTLTIAIPLIMGALAGCIGERAGVINIAIEGQLLAGAFTSAFVGSITGSILAAFVAAAVSGLLVAVLMGLFSLKYWVDQVVLGVVINMFVSGLTGFLFDVVMKGDPSYYNDAPTLTAIRIPVLADIPFFGDIFFNQTIVIYICYLSVILVMFLISKTTWGLRVRSVGEHPKAADTVGIHVNKIKWSAILVGGLFAGIGGVFYTLCQAGQFTKDMTSGHGYIALAAVIMGRWRPGLATCMALFFGLISQVGSQLQSYNVLPSSFFLMLPYLATVVAVAGLIGLVRAPKADGVIYGK